MPAQLGSGQAVAVVPLDRAGQPIGRGLYWRVAIAAVENQGLDVLSEVDQAVYLGFDVVVEEILRVVRLGYPDQRRESGGHAEMRGLEYAVWIAERAPVQRVLSQPQVGRAETR